MTSSSEISSMLPYFDCEEPGHDKNAMDQVCLDQECKYKGLCCVRCQYQRHRSHPNSVYPLHTFVSQLVSQMTQRKIMLEDQMKRCMQYRDVVVSIIKDFFNGIIDHMTEFVAQIHKYFTMFENSYENALIKSSVVVHSLMYKKHIRRDQFQKYVREGVKCVKFEKNQNHDIFKNDYYTLSQLKPQKLEDKFRFEQGGLLINDQERAFEMSNDYINEMQKVSTKLQDLTKKLLGDLVEKGSLQKMSDKIPRFEKVSDFEELSKIKSQFEIKIDTIFQTQKTIDSDKIGSTQPARKQFIDYDSVIQNYGGVRNQSVQVIESYSKANKVEPSANEELSRLTRIYENQQRNTQSLQAAQGQTAVSQLEQYSTIIDPSRTICTLGMLFETVGNCSILKQKNLRTQVNDISCIAMINNDIIAVAGRFTSHLDFYRLSDRKLVQRIETKSEQGVKYLLALRNDVQILGKSDLEVHLIVGLYYDQSSIQSYKLQLFIQENKYTLEASNSYSFTKPDYDSQSAVTALKELYAGDYFVAGFSSGSIATYHCQKPEPLCQIKYLYDQAVYGISIVEAGKIYISHSGDKCRFHYVSHLSQEKSIQNISPVRPLSQIANVIQTTQSLMEEQTTLKLIHLLCGEQKEWARIEGETRESGIRFLRIMKEDVKMNLVEEGALSNFREFGQTSNSVKELLILEPRKKMGKVWMIALGENNRLQLWEVKRAMSQNIRLWEKDLEDFLKPMNHNLVKCKLLCESNELTQVKFVDVGPKVQIVRVNENIHNGRFNILIAVVNHESKLDVDLFDIEMMSV